MLKKLIAGLSIIGCLVAPVFGARPVPSWLVSASATSEGSTANLHGRLNIYSLKADTNPSFWVRSGIVYVKNNVGIGTTSPVYPLDVNGIIRANNTIISTSGGFQTNRDIYSTGSLYNYFNSGSFRIQEGTPSSSSNILTALSGGNIGIGTIAPTSELHILKSGANATINVQRDTSDSSSGLLRASADLIEIGAISDSSVSILQNNTSAIYINESKHVGIGITNPLELVHIKDGNLFVDGQDILVESGYGYYFDYGDSNWALGHNILTDSGGMITGDATQLKVYDSNLEGFQIINHNNDPPVFEITGQGDGQIKGSFGIGGTINPQVKFHVIGNEHALSDFNKSIYADAIIEDENATLMIVGNDESTGCSQLILACSSPTALQHNWIASARGLEDSNKFHISYLQSIADDFGDYDGQRCITITTNTKVGIFQPNPEYGFDVNSESRFNGTMYIATRIRRIVDDSDVELQGGSDYDKGAFLNLTGKDAAGDAGCMKLYIHDVPTSMFMFRNNAFDPIMQLHNDASLNIGNNESVNISSPAISFNNDNIYIWNYDNDNRGIGISTNTYVIGDLDIGGTLTFSNITILDLSGMELIVSTITGGSPLHINNDNDIYLCANTGNVSIGTITVPTAKLNVFGNAKVSESLTVYLSTFAATEASPNGVGNATENYHTTVGWADVISPDPGNIWTKANYIFHKDLYEIEDVDTYTAPTVVVSANYRLPDNYGSIGGFTIVIRTHDTDYETSDYGSNDFTWEIVKATWTVNPFTSLPWTQDEINDLQVGVNMRPTWDGGVDYGQCQIDYMYVTFVGGYPEPAITLSNNLGIGTTNPMEAIDVVDGSIKISGDNSNLYVIGNIGIGTTNPTCELDVSNGEIKASTFTANSIEVVTSLISSSGTIINLFADNLSGLYGINYSTGVFSEIFVDTITFTSSLIQGQNLTFSTDTNKSGLAALFIQEGTGYVGIGTDNPSTNLYVVGKSTFTDSIYVTNVIYPDGTSSNSATVADTVSGTDDVTITADSDQTGGGDIIFITSNSVAMAVNNDRSVRIYDTLVSTFITGVYDTGANLEISVGEVDAIPVSIPGSLYLRSGYNSNLGGINYPSGSIYLICPSAVGNDPFGSPGNGGDIKANAGSVTSDPSTGGSVSLYAGFSNGQSESDSASVIIGGNAQSGTGGNVTVNAGNSTTDGNILLNIAGVTIATIATDGLTIGDYAIKTSSSIEGIKLLKFNDGTEMETAASGSGTSVWTSTLSASITLVEQEIYDSNQFHFVTGARTLSKTATSTGTVAQSFYLSEDTYVNTIVVQVGRGGEPTEPEAFDCGIMDSDYNILTSSTYYTTENEWQLPNITTITVSAVSLSANSTYYVFVSTNYMAAYMTVQMSSYSVYDCGNVFKKDYTGTWFQYPDYDLYFKLYNYKDIIYVENTKVGIGVSSPTVALEVNGDIKSDSIIFDNETIQYSAGVVIQSSCTMPTVNGSVYGDSFVSTGTAGGNPPIGLTITVTPKFNTSRFKITVLGLGLRNLAGDGHGVIATIFRDGTYNLNQDGNNWANAGLGQHYGAQQISISLGAIDFPATTSPVTYTVFLRTASAGETGEYGPNGGKVFMSVEEIAQ